MNNGTTIRELSSVGSERLPYKQRVGGSNPSAPTGVFPRGLLFGETAGIFCLYTHQTMTVNSFNIILN